MFAATDSDFRMNRVKVFCEYFQAAPRSAKMTGCAGGRSLVGHLRVRRDHVCVGNLQVDGSHCPLDHLLLILEPGNSASSLC